MIYNCCFIYTRVCVHIKPSSSYSKLFTLCICSKLWRSVQYVILQQRSYQVRIQPAIRFSLSNSSVLVSNRTKELNIR